MSWSLLTYNMLVHESGLAIKLLGGTWRHPRDIVPYNTEMFTDSYAQRLLAEGMHYLKHHVADLESQFMQLLKAKKGGQLPPKALKPQTPLKPQFTGNKEYFDAVPIRRSNPKYNYEPPLFSETVDQLAVV